ncbi:MAG: type I-E CRISPR-associated protein Cse1/CasA [Promicromonosporaceae bacterium]|nr:type I-E CRISPR-associated protein Cse1/CasA [Promicromonosporaceae bacterium]
MNTAPFFNLIDKPWLPVLGASTGMRLVSLRQAYHEADKIQDIVGDLPTQSVALLRLLLAVLHRAVQGPNDLNEWQEVRFDWSAALEDIDAYLDDCHDRFWLQHPIQPFMQVPDLRTAKNEKFGLSRIVCDGPGTSTFMTTRLAGNLESAPWPEAARWLIHAHAYDVSGIHSGAVGDPRVKNGKGYGIGTGWAGQLGVVHLIGQNLRETLLLNLIAPKVAGLEIDVDGDLPVWERPPLTALPEGWHAADGVDQPYRTPTGLVDLYTWQTRRIRLFGSLEQATGVINAQGDRATPQNRHRLEPMSAWRYSEPQTKALGHDTYMPLRHQPERAFWRGLGALLPSTTSAASSNSPKRRLPPALAEWVSYLRGEEGIKGCMLRWRAVGIEYGTQDAIYTEVWADDLTLPSSLFGDVSLADLTEKAVDSTQLAVLALGNLAQNVTLAAGGSTESDGPKQQAQARAYAELDQRFCKWVQTLDDNAQEAECRQAWHREVWKLLNGLANEIVDSAGEAALIGRHTGGQFRDAGLALRWFHKKLREALPHAFDNEDAAEQPNTEGAIDE